MKYCLILLIFMTSLSCRPHKSTDNSVGDVPDQENQTTEDIGSVQSSSVPLLFVEEQDLFKLADIPAQKPDDNIEEGETAIISNIENSDNVPEQLKNYIIEDSMLYLPVYQFEFFDAEPPPVEPEDSDLQLTAGRITDAIWSVLGITKKNPVPDVKFRQPKSGVDILSSTTPNTGSIRKFRKRKGLQFEEPSLTKSDILTEIEVRSAPSYGKRTRLSNGNLEVSGHRIKATALREEKIKINLAHYKKSKAFTKAKLVIDEIYEKSDSYHKVVVNQEKSLALMKKYGYKELRKMAMINNTFIKKIDEGFQNLKKIVSDPHSPSIGLRKIDGIEINNLSKADAKRLLDSKKITDLEFYIWQRHNNIESLTDYSRLVEIMGKHNQKIVEDSIMITGDNFRKASLFYDHRLEPAIRRTEKMKKFSKFRKECKDTLELPYGSMAITSVQTTLRWKLLLDELGKYVPPGSLRKSSQKVNDLANHVNELARFAGDVGPLVRSIESTRKVRSMPKQIKEIFQQRNASLDNISELGPNSKGFSLGQSGIVIRHFDENKFKGLTSQEAEMLRLESWPGRGVSQSKQLELLTEKLEMYKKSMAGTADDADSGLASSFKNLSKGKQQIMLDNLSNLVNELKIHKSITRAALN